VLGAGNFGIRHWAFVRSRASPEVRPSTDQRVAIAVHETVGVPDTRPSARPSRRPRAVTTLHHHPSRRRARPRFRYWPWRSVKS
jgi:hypothetical protein